MPMASRPNPEKEIEHYPARSGTPTAWKALALVSALVAGWFFFDRIICCVIQIGLSGMAWSQSVDLTVNHLELTENGTIKASGVSLFFGSREHRSSWKSDWIEVRLPSLGRMLEVDKNPHPRRIREISLGQTKILLDQRSSLPIAGQQEKRQPIFYTIPWIRLLPDALIAGPVELVIIGENHRISVRGLYAFLPDRWAGKIHYSEVVLDAGSAHEIFSSAAIPASWDGTTLRLGTLVLNKDLHLEELTLTPLRERLEFGLHGTVGNGVIRGDGSFGKAGSKTVLEATLVGENLKLESLATLLKTGNQRATGTIRQARCTFRGDPEMPLEADSALRLVADAFRWEGKGWDSLRLAATLTGRILTLSELILHQKENEVEAAGISRLPEDWHGALKAPFSATFHAMLDDAGALAALAGSDLSQLSGGLFLEGAIKGGDNKAEGYCNLVGAGMKLCNLPLDWLKGCVIFEGGKTRLSNLEAWSGSDRIVMDGEVENSLPHTYAAKAEFGVSNLTKRLAQLGVSTASQIGGGAVSGIWTGDGSGKAHSGTFQAQVTDWVSPWTKAGMSGSFEGSYSPGHLYCSKAEFHQEDLRLSLQLAASPTRLEAKSIVATRNGKSNPVVQGAVALPVNAPSLWQTGDIVSNLIMREPLAISLALHGIKAEELADLLGQNSRFTGTLEGDLVAGGTPENPEIHSALKIAKLGLSDTATTIGLVGRFDATEGRASFHIAQDIPKEAKESPLIIRGDLPFRLVADHGVLRLADAAASIRGVATLHRFSLDGWLALWRSSLWSVRDGMLDGVLNLDGTLEKPTVEGKLEVTALGASLPGIPSQSDITNLKLPVTCSLSKATSTGGSALYQGRPITISGLLDWSADPWGARIHASGKEIPFPKLGGISSQGEADINIQQQGTNIPILSGKFMIRSASGALPSRVVPFFDPPGVTLPSQGSSPLVPSCTNCQLDLQAATEEWLTLKAEGDNRTNSTQIRVSLHSKEGVWTGSMGVKDHFLELPAGRFLIPEAMLQYDASGRETLTFTAFGLTKLGFCTLTQEGSLKDQPRIDLIAANSGVTPSDLLLCLATPEKKGNGSPALLQMPFWNRQNTLFPLLPTGWVTRKGQIHYPDSMGFYGSPWSAQLFEEPGTPTLP